MKKRHRKPSPSQRVFLEYLSAQGPARLFPPRILKTIATLRACRSAGWIAKSTNGLSRPGDPAYRITDEGRAAIAKGKRK